MIDGREALMEKDLHESIKSVISSLMNVFEQEAEDENAELINEFCKRFDENEELYMAEIQMTFLNLGNLAAKPWFEKYYTKDNKNKFIIQYIYNGLLNHFVRKTIESKEDSPFVGDKEHFIMRQVQKAVMTGENQSLYATYEGCEKISKERWNDRAYWSPTCFKDTDDVIESFWKWYNVEE